MAKQNIFTAIVRNCVVTILISLAMAASADAPAPHYKVGLLIVATGRYIQFVEPLVNSARTYFCNGNEVTYFVFTDGQLEHPAKDIVTFHQKRLGWPYDTMMRFEMYDNQRETLARMDYLFACDADMLFVAPVGNEILGDLVGTQHPGYVGRRGTYETNPASRACINRHEGEIYFAGGFYGGSSKNVLDLVHTCIKNIRDDLSRNIIAIWHDESHLNRYFIDHNPTIVLSPSYCYPESWQLPYTKRLLALDKNHGEMRK